MRKPTATIANRVQRIAPIADAYCSISGDDPQDFTTDLLTDLLHYSAARGGRFGASLRHAQGHFTAEWVEAARRH
jgi:hypothetical protein